MASANAVDYGTLAAKSYHYRVITVYGQIKQMKNILGYDIDAIQSFTSGVTRNDG